MVKRIAGIVIVLFAILIAYVCFFRGIHITDKIQILSYKQVRSEVENYQIHKQTYESAVDKDYNDALRNLDNAKVSYERAKKDYETVKDTNSVDDLLNLARDKEYKLEYLWVKLDLIARNNNLAAAFQLEPVSGNMNNIKVTLDGEYLSVKNFIYDMRIDLDLQFKAENIEIVSSGSNKVKATFTIKNVNVAMQ